MRSRLLLILAAATVLVSGCAPKLAPLPVVTAPAFPDFVRPDAPPSLAGGPVDAQNLRAWTFLQAGDLRGAEREVAVALKAGPSFFPAQATSAYIALARKDLTGAVAQFTRVADAHPDYAPALAGKGLALEADNQNAAAVAAFRAALAADPSLSDLSRRVDVLTLRGLQDELAAARQAARNGQPAVAARAYRNAIAASPDSAFLYRELATVQRQQNDLDGAVASLRQARELDPSDSTGLVMLGDILEQQGQLDAAIAAYSDALTIEPDPAVDAKRAAIRARLALAALPEQYRAIDSAPQATRADLAALIGVRLPDLIQAAETRDIGVLTDIRGNWAASYIATVARAGIIEAYPNHTFQPRGVVRRVDLAQATSRLLALVGQSQRARAEAWASARGQFTDMTANHLAYPAASAAVAAGVMQPSRDGSFQPTRVVTGAEAVAAIDRIRSLAGPAAASLSIRR